ncbi:MAG: hypothetical protein EPN36_09995 [Rhodanobacteraceae bacterium]|nr:MAG: hypothetical protein EPN36_09995 [Rhodanobacteraceae bacterium]
MKRLLIAGLALALLVPVCALAQSAFNGTWKLDPTTVHQSGGEAMVISLKGGMYHCNCHPPIAVKADGLDHPVKGHDGFNTVAVQVINDHSIKRTEKQSGKVVFDSTITAAPDGKTATEEFNIYAGSTPSTGKGVLKRVAKGAPGSNAVAGSWRLDHVISGGGAVFDPTYKIEGDTVTSTDAAGNSYTAKLGGKAVPNMVNGKADGTVSVKMLGKDTLRETYAKDGKVTSTTTMTISQDGKTMKMVDHNMKSGVTTTMIHDKV